MSVLAPWVKPGWVEDDSGNVLPYEPALYVTSEDESVTLTFTDLPDDPAGVGATQVDLSATGGGGGGGGGGYKSLTGAGKTETPGALTQAGDFTIDGGLQVNDNNGDGIILQSQTSSGEIALAYNDSEGQLLMNGSEGVLLGVIGETAGIPILIQNQGSGAITLQGGPSGIQLESGLGPEETNIIVAPYLPGADPHNANQIWNNNGVLSMSAG